MDSPPGPRNVTAGPVTDSRLRLASAFLALVSIGLLLSLLPRTSFVARSANEIVDAVGPAWPEQSVEQVLDEGLDVVSEVRIWGAAGFGRGEAPVVAALLQGPDRELVRQVRVGIRANHLLQPYVLDFPPYHPAPDEDLILQLWVSPERSNHAIFGTTEPRPDHSGPTINRNPTDQGPLAYELIWRGDGWRATLAGSWIDWLRLAGGIAAATLAVFLRPTVARRLSKALRRVGAAVLADGGPIARTRLWGWRGLEEQRSDTKAVPGGRAFYVFPWLIPAFAILHYLANNRLIIRAYEAITVGAVIMASVTVIFIAMRIILKSSAAAAVFTGLVGIAFLSYGHIYVDKDPPDDRYFLVLGVPIILGVAALLRGRTVLTPAILRFLNLGSVVLVALPIAQILLFVLSASFQPDRDSASLAGFPGLDERISEAKAGFSPDELRDIYYIILDEYPRSGSPESFDNGAFVHELESRGFYVDPNARSNYPRTQWSIPASMNMNYYEPFNEDQMATYQLYNMGNDHALGRIVQALGYKYIHISSGWYFTNTSPIADLNVSFGPNGRIVSESTAQDPCVFQRILNLSNEFTVEFLRTTMAERFVRLDPRWQIGSCTYLWGQPAFVLEWIEFMKDVANISGPKFVFAHLLKPHAPYSFDRHGNVALLRSGWGDEHDVTVDSAFHGQILWLNGQLLEVVDAILSDYEEPPIIVIASDHGSRGEGFGDPMATEILAAYLLPDGGGAEIYPHMTSVNLFRVILNYYFDLKFEMLEDKVYSIFE